MKDATLTEIMIKSLNRNPEEASFEEWIKAGDYASQIRFFPHAFNCYQNAHLIKRNDEPTAEKLDTVLDKITNVLEYVPNDIKPLVEEIRLNNPLDPSKWLEISNKTLQAANENAPNNPGTDAYVAPRLALAFTVYCALRSGAEVSELNEILTKIIKPVTDPNKAPRIIKMQEPVDTLRVVALGDNVTLGLQRDWELIHDQTYHYLWGKKVDQNLSIANCGISGAGALDALLYLGRDVMNYRPDLLFINYGINDAWLGHEALPAYEALLDSVIEILKPKMQIVLISPIPHIPQNCPQDQRPTTVDLKEVEIEAWVEAAKRVANKQDIAYADAYSLFMQAPNREKLFANGFNQPNMQGHSLIADAIHEVLHFV